MPVSVAISLLAQGNTGAEILEILDAISEDVNNTQAEVIEF